MNRNIGLVIAALVVLILVGVGLSYNSRNTTTSATPTPSSTASSSATSTASASATTSSTNQSVTIKDLSFSPATLTVKKGTTVTWTNSDAMSHTVTGSNGGPSSSTLQQGDSYHFTFNTVGTFTYACSFHPSMHGTVIVTE